MNSEISKKLIKITVLVLLFSYSMDKLIFFGMNALSDKVMTGQAIGKLNHFLAQKDTADFLVFGSSRANHHIDVGMFTNHGFNAGVDGTRIAYTSALIGTLPKHKKQTIMVHIDVSDFFDESYDGSDIRALKTKYNRNHEITQALDRSGQISILQKFYYSMNYNGSLLGIIKNYIRPNYDYTNYNGYDPLVVNKTQENMRDVVLDKAKSKDSCFENHNVNKLALEYLKTIKSYADNSPNKTFLYVASPIYNDFCDTNNVRFDSIMKDYGLTYWDLTNLYKTSKNSYWKDATHMSKEGAEAFSAYLIERLEYNKNH